MNISSIGGDRNLYPLMMRQSEPTKAGDTQEAHPTQTDTVNLSESDGVAYFDSLRQKYACVKNGNVAISGAYLDKCARDPELAKRLEENLAAYEDCVRRGYQNAMMSAGAMGGKLLHYSEMWSIDGEGGLTMISRGTVEYDAGTKNWEEIREDTLERMEKAPQEKEKKETASTDKDDEAASESHGGKVAVNQQKRARQIAAAACQDDICQVIALLQKDMADCKAGLEKGWCDESEIAKVQALLSSAQARMSQLPKEAEDALGLSEFDLAGLM